MRYAIYIRNSSKDFVGHVYADDIIEALQKAKWDYSSDWLEYNFDKDIIAEKD